VERTSHPFRAGQLWTYNGKIVKIAQVTRDLVWHDEVDENGAMVRGLQRAARIEEFLSADVYITPADKEATSRMIDSWEADEYRRLGI
jgi:hypothetical protein